MPNFKKMYFNLFNRITDAINVLQAAQQEAENEYIENPDIKLLDEKKED